MPSIQVERTRRNRRVVLDEPLFPGYLFIRLQRWVDDWSPLRSTRGVSRLVAFSAEPLPVADMLVEEIVRRAAEQTNPPELIPRTRP